MISQKDIYKEKYLELEIIGRGNFGQAIIVRDQEENKLAIAKKILLGNLGKKEQEATLKESQILRQLDHPNIVKYYESFSFDEQLIIIMEYCEEGDLSFHVKQKREKKEHFPELVILNWFAQIVLSLEYIHCKKILHRDIKSQNIFLTSNGTVKLGDFGISKILEHTTDIASTVVGTPYQMRLTIDQYHHFKSPEVCESQPYSYKSDIWALGCVLYELCTLKHAFDSNNLLGLVNKIVQSKQDPIPSEYSPQLQELVNIMLSKNVNERPYIKEILQVPFVKKTMQEFVDTKEQQKQLKDESIPIKRTHIHKQMSIILSEATQQSQEQSCFDLGKTLETQNYSTCISTQKKTQIINETPKQRLAREKEEKIQREIEQKNQATRQFYIDKEQAQARKTKNLYGTQQLQQNLCQQQPFSHTYQYEKKIQIYNQQQAQKKALQAQPKNIVELEEPQNASEVYHTAFESIQSGTQLTTFENVPIEQLKQIQNKNTGKFDFKQLQNNDQNKDEEIQEELEEYATDEELNVPVPRLTKMATSQQMNEVVAVYKQSLNKTTSYSKDNNPTFNPSSPTKQQLITNEKIPTKQEKIANKKKNCINQLGEKKFKEIYNLLKKHRSQGKDDDKAFNQKLINIAGKENKTAALQIDEIIYMETI